MSGIFQNVRSLKPSRSMFDLSYNKKLTCDMGQLIPVMCDEMVPGDTFKVANQVVVRFQPLVAPIMHEVNVFVHYFFVPYRLIWDDWEEFITGGQEGTSTVVLPRWAPGTHSTTTGSLWDYMGLPMVNMANPYPLAFPKRAYNLVWQEYYRDETLQDEWDDLSDNEEVMCRAWEKDYFTSALPWRQRGTSPSIPLSGTGTVDFNLPADFYASNYIADSTSAKLPVNAGAPAGTATLTVLRTPTTNSVNTVPIQAKLPATDFGNWLAYNSIDLSSITTFNVSDLRLAFQTQKWLERNARAGARYTEFLQAHFGVSPRDERLQRPEYVGGSKNPVIVSEVLQTGSTDATSPQGNMAGHGISAGRTYAGNYTASEFGVMLGIMSIMPRTAYQQGVDRQWLRETKYDFFFPEFVGLSEQAIINQELYAGTVENTNRGIFGFQGRYDEMRVKRSQVCGLMRTSPFSSWHLGRQFASLPTLSSEFITCTPSETKRIFAVPSEPGLLVDFGNIIQAIRPLPYIAEPGYIDHN